MKCITLLSTKKHLLHFRYVKVAQKLEIVKIKVPSKTNINLTSFTTYFSVVSYQSITIIYKYLLYNFDFQKVFNCCRSVVLITKMGVHLNRRLVDQQHRYLILD